MADVDKRTYKRVERWLHDTNVRLINDACGGNVDRVNEKVRKSDHFVEPTSETWIEQHRRFRPEGYYRIHCAHDRPLWSACGMCKRNTKEANQNLLKLVTGKLY